MASILFVPSIPQSEWVQDVLPGTSPAELPVAGKRFIDYALERMMAFGFQFTEILDWRFSKRLADYLDDAERTGFHLYYHRGGGDIPHGLKEFERPTFPLANAVTDGLSVVWGLCLTACGPGDAAETEPVTEAECAETPPGTYRRVDGRWMRVRRPGRVVHGVADWHGLNFAVLARAGTFTLPGYSTEKDVHLGRNVVIERGSEITGPVLLGDDVWLARNVRFDDGAIVGKGAFIGEGTHLARTVVCDDTYVGVGLELVDKIVAGRRVIDAVSGAWADIEEPGIVRSIDGWNLGWLGRIARFIYGASRGRRN